MKNCEHELSIIMEEFFDGDDINVILQCSLCKTKFSGVLKRNER